MSQNALAERHLREWGRVNLLVGFVLGFLTWPVIWLWVVL